VKEGDRKMGLWRCTGAKALLWEEHEGLRMERRAFVGHAQWWVYVCVNDAR
jgi:hypothetical protein